jgi:hypothetical protein
MAKRSEYEALLARLGKRPRTVLKMLLTKGEVSTYELGQLGYDQPPRAAQDLKDAGVVLKRRSGTNPRTGNRMAIYSIDWGAPIARGSSERRAFPKSFVRKVKEAHGGECCIYRVAHPHNVLQVDHRIPFQVAGDPEHFAVEDFMSLSPSANRAKSWACEHCPNFRIKNTEVCRTCYWAYPDSNYTHIATVDERQTQIKWVDNEVDSYARLKKFALSKKITLQKAIKQIVAKHLRNKNSLEVNR